MRNNYINTKQRGSVLLEALISILIFSIGILGLVGMQGAAINSTSDARYRSTAGFLVDRMIGTVWAERIGSTIATASNVMSAVPNPALACGPCAAGIANSSQLWANDVTVALPNATASVVIAGPMVTVGVTWQPPNLPPGEPPHQHFAVTFIN